MAHSKANDLSAVGIGYQAQVSKVILNPQIGNVAYPQLIGAFRYQITPQIRILSETVR